MPSIDEFIAKNSQKKFKKVAYRPWTIMPTMPENNPKTEEYPPSPLISPFQENTVNEEDLNKEKNNQILIPKEFDQDNFSKGEQKGNKRGTKGEQKGNKRGTKGEQKGNTEGEQKGNKRGTKGEQKGNNF